MTDTTKPPSRPTSPRPRASGRPDGKPARGGDKPRTRSTGDAPARRDPAAKTRGAEPAPPRDDARIAKVMARAGLCSRRDAESWIGAGRVAVNGAVIDSPALNVDPGDRITVDGEPLPEREQTRLYMFHKPRGLVTTARDPEGRPTIFDSLPEGLPRVVSVGRLDINTEGLMLLTNDGGLARVLELPATGWLRRYRVRANGAIDQAKLDALKGGVTIDGIEYAGIEATLDRIQGANAWLTMGLREGKNREIKRVLESLGLAVTRLIRVSFGPFQLGELAEGAVESVPTRVLRDQLGPGLAAEANVDLDMREEAPAPRRGARDEEGTAPARPSRSSPGLPRPHVGAMRAAREEAAGEGRKRVVRGATADRKGRAVKVERVIPVATGAERTDSRNARRFASEKTGDVAGRQRTRAEASPAKRGFGAAARPQRADDARPARSGFNAKPRPEGGEVFAAKPRGERAGGFGAAARPRRDDDARPARSAAGTRARPEGREGFTAKPRGERAGGFGAAARPRRDDDARPARSAAGARARPEGGEGFTAKPRGERAGVFGAAARPRRDDDARPARSAAGARARPEGGEGFAAKPRGERAGGFGAAARPRRDDDARPARSAAGARARPEGREGFTAKPRGERAAGPSDKPRTGKPNARPGGFSSERPATGRNKPPGGRPPPRGRP